MAKIAVHYALTPAGQRASLLAGGNGKAAQSVEIEATPELLALATIDSDGNASINLLGRSGMVHSGDLPIVGVARSSTSDAITEKRHAFDALPGDIGQWILDSHRRAMADLARLTTEIEAEKAAKDAEERRIDEASVRAFLDGSKFRSAEFSLGELWLYANDDRSGGYRRIHGSRLPAELLVEARAKAEAIAAAVAARKAAQEEAERVRAEQARAEVAAWVEEHGSDRLKKCAEANMLEQCLGVYRAERLAEELGGTARWDSDAFKDDVVRNPSEAALDQLLALRLVYGDEAVSLIRQRHEDDDDGEWTTCVRIDLAWNPDRYAILPIDS